LRSQVNGGIRLAIQLTQVEGCIDDRVQVAFCNAFDIDVMPVQAAECRGTQGISGGFTLRGSTTCAQLMVGGQEL